MAITQFVYADPTLKADLHETKGVRYVYDVAGLPKRGELVLLSSASQLPVLDANLQNPAERDRVRACLVVLNTEPGWAIPQTKKPRTLTKGTSPGPCS